MKKSLYFHAVVQPQSKLKRQILNFVIVIASCFRIIPDAFLRRNMGERHFAILPAFFAAVFMLVFPYVVHSAFTFLYAPSFGQGGTGFWHKFATWYVFTFLFIYEAIRRLMEIRREPSVYDFGRYSRSTGQMHPLFRKITIGGFKPDKRMIETFIEPAVFLIAGLLLKFMGQPVGMLLIICSILYSFSYLAAYAIGDDFVLDVIDDGMMVDETEEAFVYDEDSDKTRGVEFHARKPSRVDLRRRLAASFNIRNDDAAQAI
ncbi:hypothetical protein F0L74_16685 [Chitinophaga agrisoli]|uniref:Uncharacterized protein n=1 Tax=Chitinophaga agrisoli TaxID=2607653 RepID=A0A5B2VQQ9_9BACT|nr:hypothetical protein [Chitinophaga agrisoli]KAA2241531.1 hypothetical protein F0L74_16685 [Chitinophaga agrisoli]